jgi:hypothetical protein
LARVDTYLSVNYVCLQGGGVIKIGKNGRRMATSIISVLIWTFSSLAGPGMVYCVAGPDHAAIEPIHYGLHKPPRSTGDHESALGLNLFRAAERDPEPCTDMPISGFAYSRPHSEYPQFMKLSGLPLQAASHHDLWAWMTDHHARDILPSIPFSCDFHLRTTVLLI